MLGRKIVTIGLFSLKKGRCGREAEFKCFIFETSSLHTTVFSEKNKRNCHISAISDKKTSKHTFGKKNFAPEN